MKINRSRLTHTLIYINMIMHSVRLMRRSAFDQNFIFSVAGREERHSRSKWNQSNLIRSNAVLHMKLMIEFSSAHVKYRVWPRPYRLKSGRIQSTCPANFRSSMNGCEKKRNNGQSLANKLHERRALSQTLGSNLDKECKRLMSNGNQNKTI